MSDTIYYMRFWIKRVFSIDTRSLALFRIALALLILFDLSVRARELVAHYTDLGVLPRTAFIEHYGHFSWWSFHLLSGSLWFQVLLFLVAGVFALALLFGWNTRIAMVASWLLLISLQTRNPLVLQGGDIFLRVLAFWAMFLPLGAKWSLDSLKRSDYFPNKNILSFASAGLLLQIAFVYFFSALLKSGKEWIPDGSAVYLALSIDQFATHFGKWLLMQASLLPILTYATYYLELIGPFFLFIPFWFGPLRMIFTMGFVVLQAGMGLSLRLGPFPWISGMAMLVFLPSWFWSTKVGGKIESLLDSIENKFKSPPHLQKRSFIKSETSRLFTILGNVIAAFFIIYLLLWNVQTLGHDSVPDEIEVIAQVTRTDQMWNMFSPYPLKDDGWYVIQGTLDTNRTIDLFREGKDVDWDKPEHVAALYTHERWRKYLMNLWNRDNAVYRKYYVEYLCRDWNARHDGQVKDIGMYYMLEFTLEDYQPSSVEKTLVYRAEC